MKDFWSPIQQLIETTCREFDITWQKRKRLIDTQFLVVFIFKLVLSKNKQGYGSVLEELWENNNVSQRRQTPISASSICEARQKLSSQIFIELNRRLLQKQAEAKPLVLWHGHRVFGVDGSKINLPRELINYGYKAPNKYQYYPKGLMSTVYHLGSGFIYDGMLSADKSERGCLLSHMDVLEPGDVLVLDRGYFSYLMLYMAVEKGLHLICRMQSGNVNKSVQAFLDSHEMDKVIMYEPSIPVKHEIKKQGFTIEAKPIQLRLTKYMIEDETYLCATTLLDSQHYPLKDFASVYHARWGIEELYKISKVFIDVEDFHGKTESTVKQECYAHMLLINIARIFELEAKENLPPPSEPPNKTDIKDNYWQNFCGEIKRLKINFKNCLLVLGRNLIDLLLPKTIIENDCLDKIIKSIARLRQKIRPGRHAIRQSRKPINKWKDARCRKVAYAP